MTRDQRTNIRASAQQQLLIRRPAEATDSTVTDFILDSALESAKRVLADRKRFVASEEQWVEFQTLLDAPLEPMPKLRRLLRRESTFADND
ncbi:antitoxin [Mycolicibacterium conceptionense]|nr:antitoxin [Mycolicibacterium conceptionense]OMB78984.1 antitoxin [Mycolicibacterium conceptionense]OMB83950.1 antitoxin [Mycolicibacterium conceptionense]